MTQYRQPRPPAVAIIGMACVFPGAHSPEELWQNVLAGRRFFRRAPAERLPLNEYFDEAPRSPGKTYCDQMAVITDWSFNPLDFRIPCRTDEAFPIPPKHSLCEGSVQKKKVLGVIINDDYRAPTDTALAVS